MTLKDGTPWFCSLLLISGMAQEAGSVSYHRGIRTVWQRSTERSFT